MKKLKIALPIAALALLITVGTVYAYQGDTEGTRPNFDPEKKAEMQQQKEAVHQAIEDGNYQAWAELVEGRPIAEVINEDNFDRFVEMHQLKKQAKEIVEELGLEKMGKKGRMLHKGAGNHPKVQN